MNQLCDDYAIAIQTCVDYLASLGCNLQELIDAEGFDKNACLNNGVKAVCPNDQTRARFEIIVRDIFNKKKALIIELKLTSYYQDKVNAIEAIYKYLQQQHEASTRHQCYVTFPARCS